MKLTKTETAILAHLKTHRAFCASIISGHKPRTGGKIRPVGMREWNACESLIRKGLVVQMSRDGSSVTAGGWSARCSDLVVRLPVEG